MVAVPRKAVGMMLGEEEKVFGGSWEWGTGSVQQLEVGDGVCGGRFLPGVDGDAHLQEGSQVDACKDRTGRHQSHSGGFTRPLRRTRGGPVGCGGALPSAHLPVRKANPTSIPSRFCSVSRLCGVAVSQTINPSAPRPVRNPNWDTDRDR